MADPFSITAVFAFMNSALKFSEVAIKFYSVESKNGVFVRMIQTVRQDLDETERLLRVPTVREQLISTPGKLPYIKSVIVSTKSSINEIGRLVERVRGDKEGYGSVSWENRMRWVFNDHDKLVNRRMELASCHQALSTVLIYLTPLERGAPAQTDEPPEYHDATSLDQYISPAQRRRNARFEQKSAIQPNEETEVVTADQVRTTEEDPSEAVTMFTAGEAKDIANYGFLSNPNPLPQSITCFSVATSTTENNSIPPTFQASLDPKPKFDISTRPITPPAQPEDHIYSLGSEKCSTTTYTETMKSDYSPPWFQDQAQPSSSSHHRASEPGLGLPEESFVPENRTHTLSLLALSPKVPLDTQQHRFSATSFGPVDPYSFTPELDATPSPISEEFVQKSGTAKAISELTDRDSLPSSTANPVGTYAKLSSRSSVIGISELPENTIPFNPISDRPISQASTAPNSPPNSSQYTYSPQPGTNGIRHQASSYTLNSLDSFELPSTSILPRPASSEISSEKIPIPSRHPSASSRKSSYQPYRGPACIDDTPAQAQSTSYQYQSPNQYPSRPVARSISPMSSVSTLLMNTSLADPDQDKYPIPVPDSLLPRIPIPSKAESPAPAQATNQRLSQPLPYPYETPQCTSQYQIPDYCLHQLRNSSYSSAHTLSPMSSMSTLTSSLYPTTPDDYVRPVTATVDHVMLVTAVDNHARPLTAVTDYARPMTAASVVSQEIPETPPSSYGQPAKGGTQVPTNEVMGGVLTMGESRRRNQRAMLEILARGNGDGDGG